jgi:hypothetical protein
MDSTVVISMGGNRDNELGTDDHPTGDGSAPKSLSQAEEERWQREKDWKRKKVDEIHARVEQAISEFERGDDDQDGVGTGELRTHDASDFRESASDILTSFKLLAIQREDLLQNLTSWFKRYGTRRGGILAGIRRSSGAVIGASARPCGDESGDGGAASDPSDGSDSISDDDDDGGEASASALEAQMALDVSESPAAREVVQFSKQVTQGSQRLASLHTQMVADARSALLALERKLEASASAYEGYVSPVEVRRLADMLSQSQQFVEQLRGDLDLSSQIQEKTAGRLAAAEKAARARASAEKMLRHELERLKAEAGAREASASAEGGQASEQIAALKKELQQLRAEKANDAETAHALRYDVAEIQTACAAAQEAARLAAEEKAQLIRDKAAVRFQTTALHHSLDRLKRQGAVYERELWTCARVTAVELQQSEIQIANLRAANEDLSARFALFDDDLFEAEGERKVSGQLRGEVGRLLDEIANLKDDADASAGRHKTTARRNAELEAEATQHWGRQEKAEVRVMQLLAGNIDAGRALASATAREHALLGALAHADARLSGELEAAERMDAQLRLTRARRVAERAQLQQQMREMERLKMVADAEHINALTTSRNEGKAESLAVAQEAAARYARNAAAANAMRAAQAGDSGSSHEAALATALADSAELSLQVISLGAQLRTGEARAAALAHASAELRQSVGRSLSEVAAALVDRADAYRWFGVRAVGDAHERLLDALQAQLDALQRAAVQLVSNAAGAEPAAADRAAVGDAGAGSASERVAIAAGGLTSRAREPSALDGAADGAADGTADGTAEGTDADGREHTASASIAAASPAPKSTDPLAVAIESLDYAAALTRSILCGLRAKAPHHAPLAKAGHADVARFQELLRAQIGAHARALRAVEQQAHPSMASSALTADMEAAAVEAADSEQSPPGVAATTGEQETAAEGALVVYQGREADVEAEAEADNETAAAVGAEIDQEAAEWYKDGDDAPSSLSAPLVSLLEWSASALDESLTEVRRTMQLQARATQDARVLAAAAGDPSAMAAIASELERLRARVAASVSEAEEFRTRAAAEAEAALAAAAASEGEAARRQHLEKALAGLRRAEPTADAGAQTEDSAELLARAHRERIWDAPASTLAADAEMVTAMTGGGTRPRAGAAVTVATWEQDQHSDDDGGDIDVTSALVRQPSTRAPREPRRRSMVMGVELIDKSELWADEQLPSFADSPRLRPTGPAVAAVSAVGPPRDGSVEAIAVSANAWDLIPEVRGMDCNKQARFPACVALAVPPTTPIGTRTLRTTPSLPQPLSRLAQMCPICVQLSRTSAGPPYARAPAARVFSRCSRYRPRLSAHSRASNGRLRPLGLASPSAAPPPCRLRRRSLD